LIYGGYVLFQIACAEMAAKYPTCSMALGELDCNKLEAEVKIEVGFLWSRWSGNI